MSTQNPEQTGTNRPDTWKDGELAGPTGIPPKGERHEDYFPSKWYQRRGVQAAGAVLGLLGAGAAVFGATQGGEANPTPERNPAATATANPGEGETPSETTSSEAAEAVIGEPGSTMENISVSASQELINEALKPVTVAEFKTPEEALVQFGKIENVRYLSGTSMAKVDEYNGQIDELSPESIALSEQIWQNMLSEQGLQQVDWHDNVGESLRAIITMQLYFYNESSPRDGLVATWHRDWNPLTVTEVGENTYETTVNKHTITNFAEIDPEVIDNYIGIQSEMDYESNIRIHHDGERWYIDSMTANQ